MLRIQVIFLVALVAAQLKMWFAEVAAGCLSDKECSLNGVCSRSGACVCDEPWEGNNCGRMAYAVTTVSAKSLYNLSDPRNTWNGPIVGPDENNNGKYYMYVPLYDEGSLAHPKSILQGIADNVVGPYEWRVMPNIPASINPAFLVFTDSNKNGAGEKVYSLWLGNRVWTAKSAAGPFREIQGFTYPGVNPAPIFHNGVFYLTNQRTKTVYKINTLEAGQTWTVWANISHEHVAEGTIPEDPFMWIDKRGNWHIINHAYDLSQKDDCGKSVVSTHFFSTDGQSWNCSGTAPYGHTVQYDDGTSHTYVTLERPYIHFDITGKTTYLGLSADLVTGDEGCAPRPCTNCKWRDHAGSILISLRVATKSLT